MTWPDEPHGSTTGTLEVVTYYAVTMHLPRSANSFLALPANESQTLLDALWRLPRQFRATPKLSRSFPRAYETMSLPADDLNGAAVRSSLVTLLLDILAAGRRGERETDLDDRIASALALMRANLSEPLDLKDIARAVGWSLPHFNARFRKETGTTPARHYLRLRVLEGVRRITAGGQSITRVAHALDFSSSQYFATCVRRVTGRSPRMFQGGGGGLPRRS
ncbi:MAG: helix-turn-helix domain-containing protein [Planctomycetota bacterium]